jgi:hypothetical protein
MNWRNRAGSFGSASRINAIASAPRPSSAIDIGTM